MRIAEISVKNLVNTFNHSIPLNLKDRITIIHGMNGFGKTSLLRLINGLFNYRYYELREIPFTELRITFDDGARLLIRRMVSPEKEKGNHGRPKQNLRSNARRT